LVGRTNVWVVLGISPDNVVAHDRGVSPSLDGGSGVVLVRHRPDPAVASEGIDRLHVVRTDDDRYRVDYRGGRLVVTGAGVEELGAALLGAGDRLPAWHLEDSEARPWWVSDDGVARATVRCDCCGERRDTRALFVPGAGRGGEARVCRDCWARVRNGRSPGVVDPATRVKRLVADLGADDPAARRGAADALPAVADAHPVVVADVTPALATHVDHDDPVVRGATFAALGAVADDAPNRVTPVADAAVAALDDPNDRVVAGAARVVAGVADDRPDAVREAIPALAALFGSERVPPATLVRGLDRIGAGYPAAILPAVDALLDQAASTAAGGRAEALSAVGRVADAHPGAVEPAIPRLTALFDADRSDVRAAAAAVLADVAEHCPDVAAPAAERVATLLAGAEDQSVHSEATAVLAGLARTHPERVRDAGAVEPLVGALAAGGPCTRSNAAWILGQIGARDARDALAARRADDPEAEVREAASWALDRLEESAE
jgi:hypothetical protein